MSIYDIGGSVKYGEAIALVEEIAAHDGSHLSSELAGMTRPMSMRDVYAQTHLQAFLNVNRDTKQQPEPVQFPLPWPDRPAQPEVTQEERDRLRAVLERRSAFADR